MHFFSFHKAKTLYIFRVNFSYFKSFLYDKSLIISYATFLLFPV